MNIKLTDIADLIGVVFCPKCEGRIEIGFDVDLSKIAVDCPTCDRIIECDEWPSEMWSES